MTRTKSDAAMVGKSKHKRLDGDAYSTPDWCTEALISQCHLPKLIWEPAAGEGNMVRVLESFGHKVLATDILTGDDFLKAEPMVTGADAAIVTNPPYTLAFDFICKALTLTAPHGGMVAMLLRNEYDSAKTRVSLFNQPPFAKKIVLTKRPQWIPGKPINSPRHNFSFFIWDWAHKGPAVLAYA